MRDIQLAELRDSWTAWLGVALVFVAVNLGLGLSGLLQATAVNAGARGLLPEVEVFALTFSASTNLFLSVVVGIAVISSATSLVVDSRRGSLARLGLVGATPAQIRGTVRIQLIAVSLASAVVGQLLAMLLLQPLLDLTMGSRAQSGDYTGPPPPAVYSPTAVILAAGFTVLVALIGGARQAKRASMIAPVEALRQATTGASTERFGVGKWIRVVLLALAVAAFFAIPTVVKGMSEDPEAGNAAFSTAMQGTVFSLVLATALVGMLTPLLVGPLTRIWAGLIPAVDPVWGMARQNIVARGMRMARTVVPMMFSISLLVGMVMVGESLNAMLRAAGAEGQLENIGLSTMLPLLGMPLIIALGGGIGSLIMMSRQRDAELALAGVVGATPAQRVAMPAYEAVIMAVNALLLSAIPVTIALVLCQQSMQAIGMPFVIAVPWASLFWVVLVLFVVVVAATVLPTLGSLSKPEPKVIARLIAE